VAAVGVGAGVVEGGISRGAPVVVVVDCVSWRGAGGEVFGLALSSGSVCH
jgi:hypothetical protein